MNTLYVKHLRPDNILNGLSRNSIAINGENVCFERLQFGWDEHSYLFSILVCHNKWNVENAKNAEKKETYIGLAFQSTLK